MDQLKLEPGRRIAGEVVLPGSKSLTNRALLLSALARGTTRLKNPLASDDTGRMVTALKQLGVTIEQAAATDDMIVHGQGGLPATPSNRDFFLGNAGTAIRPLTAILSLVPGEFTIDGDQYMRERPIEHLVDALSALGAKVQYLGRQGCPPLRLEGGHIEGGHATVAGNISSQYLTSLLLALPLALRDSDIEVVGEQVSKPYLEITLGIMERFGVRVSHDGWHHVSIPGGQTYQSPGEYLIEGDASSASYFFGAAAIAGEITVYGIGADSVQGDVGFLDTIAAMGASVCRHSDHIVVRQGKLRGIDVDLNHIPDAAMTIAVMALFAEGETRIRNVYNWRVKETDRMTAMATELAKLGAAITTTPDSITINPPSALKSAVIDTYGDHRMAMCFSLAALGNVPVTINDPDCVGKTFPGYFSEFDRISTGSGSSTSLT